jgi:superoxide dismutase
MFHSAKALDIHKKIFNEYKERLDYLEGIDHEEKEEPFERTYLHNAIYLHNMWFEQMSEGNPSDKAQLFEEILERRESNIVTFEKWMNDFAEAARPNGWAVWGWSYAQKTFVGFPIRENDNGVPIGITPLIVIDCWEHSYIYDFENDFETYLAKFWKAVNWKVIEQRHTELAAMFGFQIK